MKGIGKAVVDFCQGPEKPDGVAPDERLAEFCLAGEVIVEGSLGQPQFRGNIGVTECVESPHLNQAFRGIEYLDRGVVTELFRCLLHSAPFHLQ